MIPSEAEIRGRFRNKDFADQMPVRREDVYAVAGAGPDPPVRVAADAVGNTFVDHAENPAIFQLPLRAFAGHIEDAQLLFEKLLGYANHLGLFSEEVSGKGEAIGNYPQALTHLGLISAAFNLDRLLG